MGTGTKVLSNQRVTVRAGLASGISNWANPLLSEITALTDVSGAVNWDQFNLNLQASTLKDDRTLTDGAGAQSRSPYVNFGGNLQFVHPLPADTSSIYRTAYTLFSTPRVQLVVAVRYAVLNSSAPAAGDKWYLYHVETDSVSFGQNDVSRHYQVGLAAQNDVMPDYIVPAASATAPSVTLNAAVGTVAANTLIFASALYQSWDITKSATWVSSDPTKLVLVAPGIFRCIATGTPTIAASYPGSLTSTPATVTIT